MYFDDGDFLKEGGDTNALVNCPYSCCGCLYTGRIEDANYIMQIVYLLGFFDLSLLFADIKLFWRPPQS